MNKDAALDRIRELRAEFARVHEAGTLALKRGDHKGFTDAIDRERELIEEQRALLDANRTGNMP